MSTVCGIGMRYPVVHCSGLLNTWFPGSLISVKWEKEALVRPESGWVHSRGLELYSLGMRGWVIVLLYD